MQTYIAILRGINVGGHRKIKMEALRKLCADLGFQEVKTYIQSGNIAFQHKDKDYKALEKQLSQKIKTDFGFDVPVMVRQLDELTEIYENNPFLQRGVEDNKTLHVTFLSDIPDAADIAQINEGDYTPDEFIVKGRVVYLYCEKNYHKSKLSNNFFEKKLKRKGTTRNWRTVTKLVEMAR